MPPGVRDTEFYIRELRELVASGMFEHADRNDLVVLPVDFAEIGQSDFHAAFEAAPADFFLHRRYLFRRSVQAMENCTVAFMRMEHESAEAAADIDDAFTP